MAVCPAKAEIGWSNGWPMATNRTPISRDPAKRITPKALAAYRRLLAAEDDDEYSDARVELTLALGRAPWQYDVYPPHRMWRREACFPLLVSRFGG